MMCESDCFMEAVHAILSTAGLDHVSPLAIPGLANEAQPLAIWVKASKMHTRQSERICTYVK